MDKNKKLNDTIKKISLPKFSYKKPLTDKEKMDSLPSVKKRLVETQRMIDIARSRGVPMKGILSYDRTENNMLFDGSLTKKTVKHVLVRFIDNNDCIFDSKCKKTYISDT